jgi:hypothetical protein
MSRREERAIRCEAQDLVAEAEAMLSGGVVARPWWHHGLQGWVSVNTLAHADRPTLSDVADGVFGSRSREWDTSLRFLASELLVTTGTAEALEAAQRAEIVPLELDVLAGTAPAPRTPRDLVALVLPRIIRAAGRRQHPSTGR